MSVNPVNNSFKTPLTDAEMHEIYVRARDQVLRDKWNPPKPQPVKDEMHETYVRVRDQVLRDKWKRV
jgi:hypothetical protein